MYETPNSTVPIFTSSTLKMISGSLMVFILKRLLKSLKSQQFLLKKMFKNMSIYFSGYNRIMGQ